MKTSMCQSEKVHGQFIQERKHESHWKPLKAARAETLQLTRQFCNVCCFIVGHLERLGQSTQITSWAIHCHDRFHSGNSGNIVVLTCHTWNELPSCTLKHCRVYNMYFLYLSCGVIFWLFLRVLTNEDIVWLQVSVDNAELVHEPQKLRLDSLRARSVANFGQLWPPDSDEKLLGVCSHLSTEKQKRNKSQTYFNRLDLWNNLWFDPSGLLKMYSEMLVAVQPVNSRKHQGSVPLENQC